MRRRVSPLQLNRETVRELSQPELRRVAGGAIQAPATLAQDCLASLTPTCGCTGFYPSINAPCNGTN